MANVLIYSTNNCSFCMKAKKLLENKDVAYTELRVDENVELMQEMESRTGKRSVPQIFINGESIGGFDELYALERSGSLDQLLEESENG